MDIETLEKEKEFYINEIEEEVENLKYLLDTCQIEYINLYQIYITLNDLINNKKIIENKINDLKLLE